MGYDFISQTSKTRPCSLFHKRINDGKAMHASISHSLKDLDFTY